MLSGVTGFWIIAFAFVPASTAQVAAPGPLADAPIGAAAQIKIAAVGPRGAAPIDAAARLHWLVRENLAPTALLENVAIGAEETLSNSPKEYGPHWEGYGKRVGIVTANYGVQTVMEAGLGSIWGEDPRYERIGSGAFRSRLGHVIKMTFLARDRAGNTMPAYSRFLAIPGSSFLANTWMPDSQATAGDAAVRTGLGFLGRMGENAYREFWPRH